MQIIKKSDIQMRSWAREGARLQLERILAAFPELTPVPPTKRVLVAEMELEPEPPKKLRWMQTPAGRRKMSRIMKARRNK